MSALSDRSEYGIRHIDDERVFHMHSLTDAIQAWREQDNRDHWQIVERHIGRWEEVSA